MAIQQALRELAAQACAAEVRQALLPLAQAFAAWQQGQLPQQDLLDSLQDFAHRQVARKIQEAYSGPGAMPDLMVAAAIVRGLLPESAVPPPVRDALAGLVAMLRRRQEAGGPDEDASSHLASVL